LKSGLTLKESESNFYWQCVKNSGLIEIVNQLVADDSIQSVQVCFEGAPCQKGFAYGLTKPRAFVFKVIINGKIIPFYDIETTSPDLLSLWTPYETSEWYIGLGDSRRNGKEQVSGKGLHTREGVVITPLTPRNNRQNSDLAIKYISDAYAKKETGDELS